MPRVQQKRGTASALASVNPTPAAGEIVWDSTENAIKIGDGTTAWTSLAYVTATPRPHTHTLSQISDISIPNPLTENSVIRYTAGVGWSASNSVGTIGVGSQPLGGWPSGSVGAALASKVDASDSRLSDTRTPTDGSVTTAKVADSNVTYAKLQNVSATNRLLGRSSAGAGVVEEITCTAFGRSLIDDADAAAGRTTLGAAPTANPIFTGVITVAAGSATSPALTFSDDTDTGVYRAGVNSLAFSTNGTEQLRIGPDGEVGIGMAGSSTIGLRILHNTNANNIVGTVLNVQLPASALTSFGYWTAPSLLADNTAYTSHIHYIANPISSIPSGSSAGTEVGYQFGNSVQQHTVRAFVSALNSLTGYERYAFLASGSAPSLFNGSVWFANGAVGTPSIAFSSDTNTGLFAPAADVIAITTGGSERVRVDSAGDVRIGTQQTASAALDVQRASSTLYATHLGAVSGLNGSSQAAVAVKNLSSTTGAFCGYVMLCRRGDNSEQVASIGAVSTDDSTFAPHIVFTQRTASTGQTERLRIDHTGRVGVATNSPTALLDVNADTLRLRTARTPASATAAGNAGDICWDANFVHVCTATNTWRRAAITTDGLVATSSIANDAVTYAKIQNVSSTDRLLGRSSAGAGDIEEITCTAFGRSLIDDADAATARGTLGAAPAASPTFTGTATFNGPIREGYVSGGNTGASKTIALTNGTLQDYTLTGNCTFTMPGVAVGQSFTLLLRTGAGGFTATFTGVKWPGNSPPVVTTTANRMDLFTFVSDGGNWFGNFAKGYQP